MSTHLEISIKWVRQSVHVFLGTTLCRVLGPGPSLAASGYLHCTSHPVGAGTTEMAWHLLTPTAEARVEGGLVSVALVTAPASLRPPQHLSNWTHWMTLDLSWIRLKLLKYGNRCLLINCYRAFPNMKLHKSLKTFNIYNKTSEVTDGPHKHSSTHFANISENKYL